MAYLLFLLLLLLYAILCKSQALHRKFTVTLLFVFIVSFCRSLCYTCFAVHPRYLTGEGVKGLNHLLTILESVVANVISHYICKWLGKLDKNRKPD